MTSLGLNSISPVRTIKGAAPHSVGRRLERLRSDHGLRLLLHAKAHLWTDLMNLGIENNSAIDFLSDFILSYTRAEEAGSSRA